MSKFITELLSHLDLYIKDGCKQYLFDYISKDIFKNDKLVYRTQLRYFTVTEDNQVKAEALFCGYHLELIYNEFKSLMAQLLDCSEDKSFLTKYKEIEKWLTYGVLSSNLKFIPAICLLFDEFIKKYKDYNLVTNEDLKSFEKISSFSDYITKYLEAFILKPVFQDEQKNRRFKKLVSKINKIASNIQQVKDFNVLLKILITDKPPEQINWFIPYIYFFDSLYSTMVTCDNSSSALVQFDDNTKSFNDVLGHFKPDISVHIKERNTCLYTSFLYRAVLTSYSEFTIENYENRIYGRALNYFLQLSLSKDNEIPVEKITQYLNEMIEMRLKLNQKFNN